MMQLLVQTYIHMLTLKLCLCLSDAQGSTANIPIYTQVSQREHSSDSKHMYIHHDYTDHLLPFVSKEDM